MSKAEQSSTAKATEKKAGKNVAVEEKKASEESNAPKVITKTIILPDGSYGTETVVVDPSHHLKAR